LFGSFLVALPTIAIFHQSVEIFEFYGMAALAAAIIKTSFMILDKCPPKLIWIGIVFDIVLAVLLLSSFFV